MPGGIDMENVVMLVIALAVVAYLIVTLLSPEKF